MSKTSSDADELDLQTGFLSQKKSCGTRKFVMKNHLRVFLFAWRVGNCFIISSFAVLGHVKACLVVRFTANSACSCAC